MATGPSGGSEKAFGEFSMPAKSRYTLQRTMIIYFLLIGFASVLVGVEFLVDFHGGTLKAEIWENITQYEQHKIGQESILAPIDRLRSKAILMVAIIMFVMVIVLTMFIKNITEPLQHMIRLSEKISAGDLSHTIRINANNELSELGGVINEMASNLQEIILLSQQMCNSGRQFVDYALDSLRDNSLGKDAALELQQAVKELGAELTMLNEVIAYFSFYSVGQKRDAE